MKYQDCQHMNKEKKNKILPKLRFPEFINNEEWRERTLGQMGDFTGGGTPSKSDQSFWEGYLPWVSSSDIDEESIYEINVSKFITEEALKDSATKMVPPNSILLVSRVGVGKLAVSEKSICTSQDFTNFTPKNENLFFLAYLLKSKKKNLLAFSQGMAIKGFTKDDISQLKILVPPDKQKKEQQKIASCFSSLDDLITAEKQKLDALKVHKKGLMQQLFPAEGKTSPKLRFREFQNNGEWKEKLLDELLEFKNGINASKEQYGKGIKFINVLDILQNEFITHEKIIGSVDVSEDIANNFSVNYGDILFQRSSETQEEAGTANVYLDKEHAATFGGFVIRGKKIGEYDPVFLNKLLKTETIRHDISSKSGGSTRFNIGQEILSSIKIFLPSLNEQQKIADFFSSLDKLISGQTEKIILLRLHKKGLMQQLFPSNESA